MRHLSQYRNRASLTARRRAEIIALLVLLWLVFMFVGTRTVDAPHQSPPEPQVIADIKSVLEQSNALVKQIQSVIDKHHTNLNNLHHDRDDHAMPPPLGGQVKVAVPSATAPPQWTTLHVPSQSAWSPFVADTTRHAKVPPSSEGVYSPCRSMMHRQSNTVPVYTQCTQGLEDVVSSFVHRDGFWRDCLPQVALATLASMYVRPLLDGRYATLDVGANIGSCATLLASRGFHVTAMEPVQRNVDALHQTVYVNKMQDRVTLLTAAASTESLLQFNITVEVGNHGNSVMIQPGNPAGDKLLKAFAKTEVETITTLKLEDLVAAHVRHASPQHAEPHFHFAKLDCQGCEYAAAKGAEHPLLSHHMIDLIYVEVDTRLSRASGHEPGHLLALLHAHGYRMFVPRGANSTRLVPAEFDAFVEACIEDPRDVVAASPPFMKLVPEDVLRRVMEISIDQLTLWLTDANTTDYRRIPKTLLMAP